MTSTVTRTIAEHTADLAEWIGENSDTLDNFRRTVAGGVRAEIEHNRELMTLLYEAGWSRWGWPEEVGGLGGSELHRAALYDGLGAAGIEIPEVFVIIETVAPVLAHYAPELAADHLPAYLRGDEVWGQGFSEPEAGSDLASVRTSARATDDGFLLNGQKIWMTLGPSADYALVLARTGTTESRHRGLTMLWVNLASAGVTVRPIVAANGREEFAEVFFEDVEVPAEYLVGPQDGGWGVAMFLLQYERGMYAWLRQSILHHRLSAVAGRVRPGVTRLSRAVGEAFVLLAALRARSVTTVTALAEGRNPGPVVSVDKMLLSSAERATFEAARKAQFEEFVVSDDLESTTLRDEWFYSRATSIFGGAVDVQRDIVAQHVLCLPKGGS
ncbi:MULTISPECIES: acyl-CoA dehydrogenase family protein [Rhodococcus]|uniref:acyl-CoA dehydrogenase family protein n=1 Tax=Rhodococcus TaxID=1827 RepID=UPI000EA950A0|nr:MULTISPECIES: acyl-CoA dehydrogenase family protein [Rhodococcus]MDI9940132.1 acyl-CoA dehydrogenase family protein [Rhodococcus sp. IEGM 1351]RKM74346.1 acyl-CoA dehydrogenase [Rhodococcus opacus]UZG55076.1 acyl-CoA dehydrogenase family protein [Rhodococcus opacus]